MRILLALMAGYLLGSVLPADLLARARGVDIRAMGTHNPGATNAWRQLGAWPGLITGAYDCSVGLLSMALASQLGLAQPWVYLAGFSAVIGHVFPIFFRFRGGQGMAATTGMLVYGIGVALSEHLLTAVGMLVLGALAIAVFALTRSASVVGVVAVPLLVVELVLSRPDWQFAVFMSVLAIWIWVVQFGLVREGRLFRLAEPARQRLGRARSRLH